MSEPDHHDDMAERLPDAPEPAPVPRDRAIGAALARFDALKGSADSARQRDRQARKRTLPMKPIRTALAASIVVIVAAPIAWHLSREHRDQLVLAEPTAPGPKPRTELAEKPGVPGQPETANVPHTAGLPHRTAVAEPAQHSAATNPPPPAAPIAASGRSAKRDAIAINESGAAPPVRQRERVTTARSQAVAKPRVEIAFVLDTTGSMGRLLDGAKRKIWSIVTSVVDASPDADIRVGLVAYRDIGDDYVTTTFDLTTDIQDVYAKLLKLDAAGGGDWPESVNEALDIGINKLQWTRGDDCKRIVFLVGDAPPHMNYPQDVKYPQTLATARQRDIVVNTVLAGSAADTARVWQDIAQLGAGRFIPIPQNGGELVVITTPYDDDIIVLQREINGTVIPYGPKDRQRRVEEKTQQLSDVAAAAPSSATDMASYFNKRSATSSEAVSGDGDLVAAVASGRTTVAGVKDDDLPDDLRKLTREQREGEIAKQIQRRKDLNAKLATLVQQRDAFVAGERKKAAPARESSFDRAVEDTLRAQIKR